MFSDPDAIKTCSCVLAPDDALEKDPETDQASLLRHNEKQEQNSEYSESEHHCMPMLSRKDFDFTELPRRRSCNRSRFCVSSQLIVPWEDLCSPSGFLHNDVVHLASAQQSDCFQTWQHWADVEQNANCSNSKLGNEANSDAALSVRRSKRRSEARLLQQPWLVNDPRFGNNREQRKICLRMAT